MEEFPKENTEQGGESTLSPEMQGLADMAGKMGENDSAAEQVENDEAEEPIAEKYYEQAREERGRWAERAEGMLKEAKGLKPENLEVYSNLKAVVEEGEEPEYRPLDMDNPSDVEAFEEHKAREVEKAEERIKRLERDYNLDVVAKAFRNIEMIDRIMTKFKNNENLDNEEDKYLDKLREQQRKIGYTFGFGYETPEILERRLFEGGVIRGMYFDALLNPERPDFHSVESVLWRACLKEDERRGRAILHENEEIQGHLENMEERRENDPFAGETNVDSETGEVRTFTPEDNYPRLEGESDEEWANRLKRIQLKTRLAEKRQEQE